MKESRMKKINWFLLIGLPLIIFAPQLLSACPGCNALSDNSLGQGFNSSVLFLMSMPFVVFGSIAMGIILVTRNSRTPRHDDEYSNKTEETEH